MILRLWFDITASHDDEDESVGVFALTNPVISGSGEDLKVDYDDVKLFCHQTIVLVNMREVLLRGILIT